jgi:hypothetical protein
VPGERGQVGVDRLVVADVGAQLPKHGRRASVRRHRQPAVRHDDGKPAVFKATVFPPVFGPDTTSSES